MNVLSDIKCVWVGYLSILKESDLKGGQKMFLCLIQLCLKESNKVWNQRPFKASVNECNGVLF